MGARKVGVVLRTHLHPGTQMIAFGDHTAQHNVTSADILNPRANGFEGAAGSSDRVFGGKAPDRLAWNEGYKLGNDGANTAITVHRAYVDAYERIIEILDKAFLESDLFWALVGGPRHRG